MSAVPRSITLLWCEKLSPKMFVDFYRKIYLGGEKPLVITPSLFNSSDVVLQQMELAKAANKNCLFTLLEIPKVFDSSQTPQGILDASDLVLHFKLDEGTGVRGGVLTIPVKIEEAHQPILDRWTRNILLLQQIEKVFQVRMPSKSKRK